MQVRYLSGIVQAKRDTDKALLCSFDWNDTHGYCGSDVWVPLSVIHEDDHDSIAAASSFDLIEISIAEWWLIKNF